MEKMAPASFELDRDVLEDVERDRALAHARTAGDHHELARLQPSTDRIVEIEKTRGNAGDAAFVAVVERLLDLLERARDVRAQGKELAAALGARGGDAGEELLGTLEHDASGGAVRVVAQL
jgi:hypothetical protein